MDIRVWLVSLAGVALLAASALGQSVPDSIMADGVPAVPAALTPELNRYQNIRSASFQDWVPGRRAQLILTRFGNTNQVHRVAFPGGARTQLTFLAERMLSASGRPGSPQFSYTMDEGGAQNYQIFLQDERSGDATRLTDGRSRNKAPNWWSAGTRLAWSSNARNGRDMDLYVADRAEPGAARLFKEVAGTWTVADWAPDDRRVAAIEYISINETYVHLVDVATGDAETLTPAARQAPAQRRPSATGQSAGRRTAARSTGRPTSARSSNTWPATIWPRSSRLRSRPASPGTSRTRLSRRTAPGSPSSPMRMVSPRSTSSTPRTAAQLPPPALPAGQISGLAFRKGTHEFGFTLSSARSPADAYSYDLDSARLERWTESETAGLDPESFPEPELIHYPTLRRPHDPGIRLSARRRQVPRPSTGADRHPRRPRKPIPPRVPGPAELFDQQARDS